MLSPDFDIILCALLYVIHKTQHHRRETIMKHTVSFLHIVFHYWHLFELLQWGDSSKYTNICSSGEKWQYTPKTILLILLIDTTEHLNKGWYIYKIYTVSLCKTIHDHSLWQGREIIFLFSWQNLSAVRKYKLSRNTQVPLPYLKPWRLNERMIWV